MKKLTKSIAFVAIAAIAGYNAYQMSEINAINNDLSLDNIENVAQADEVIFQEGVSSSSYAPMSQTALLVKSEVVTTTSSNTEGGGVNCVVNGSYQHGNTKTTTVTKNTYVYPCLGNKGDSCTPLTVTSDN